MQYSFPVQDPVSAAEMGLIPVEFDSESFRNPDEHMSKTSRDGKIVASHVLSVCKRCTPSLKMLSLQASACSESSLTAGIS
jgi:hypothetical protein